MNTNSYTDVTRVAVMASRVRHTVAPTPVTFRGGAVSIDGFTLARDPASWIRMI
jgi:hypothetical protein